MIFVELPIFTRCAQGLFEEDELAQLQFALLENPEAGDRLQGGRGLRKLRVSLPGRGKRGGARVIYYHWASESRCYLVYAYAKNHAADLTKDQLKQLAELMAAEVQDG